MSRIADAIRDGPEGFFSTQYGDTYNLNIFSSPEAYMVMHSQRMLAKDSKICISSAAVTKPMEKEGSETLNMNSPSLPEHLRQEVEELNREYDIICEEYRLKKDEVLRNVAECKSEDSRKVEDSCESELNVKGLNSLEESLDRSTESAHQLFDKMPEEGEKFQIADQTWRDMIKNTAGAPGCLDASKDAERLQKLKDANILLEIINKGLASYLEDKWVAFPHLFFLSNDEMLEILSETKDPLRVDGEIVPFTDKLNPKSSQGAVEKWLLQAEEGMLQSVQDQCAKFVVAYAKSGCEKWVLNWPEQVVLVMSAIYWTRKVSTVDEMYSLLPASEVKVPTDDKIKNDDLHDSVQCYGDSIESIDLFVKENKNSMMGELDKQVNTLNEELIEILGALHSRRLLTPESNPREIVGELEQKKKAWQIGQFTKLNGPEKEAYRMGKENKEDTVVFILKDSIDDFKIVLPLIEELTNEALKGRHWTYIFGLLGQSFNLQTLSITELIKFGIESKTNEMHLLSVTVSKEFSFKKTLDKMVAEWDGMEFVVLPYKDSSTYILGGIDNIHTILDN
eukprot:Gb_06279 [translate_table: standard]